MRAKAGDPPRTMAHKILAGRTADPTLSSDLVTVKADHVVVCRDADAVLREGVAQGLKRTPIEVAVAYDLLCTSGAALPGEHAPTSWLSHGGVIARPGAGFPATVHLERFAGPARLCVTDDRRLAALGGVGMLAIVMPTAMLGRALASGECTMRPPRSIQILLSGKLRPFVGARDIALELMRRGLADVVRRIDQEHRAPVVLEFTGPSVRLLSVSERAIIAALAPDLGAAGALFLSDERTEVFLRDQRRSKAHRGLSPDAGAPCEEAMTVDLSAVDPLVLDASGAVKTPREFANKPVSQVILGGDVGATLRDIFSVASLLKSKRVPAGLDFLLAVPSRQMLEVLAAAGALSDLIATGARLIEPDGRLLDGTLYGAPNDALSVRTVEAGALDASARNVIMGSAETVAAAVATGQVGDPRLFKRPVRITVPRTLTTDDVFIVRDRKASAETKKTATKVTDHKPRPPFAGGEVAVDLPGGTPDAPLQAFYCPTLGHLAMCERNADAMPAVAVLAPFIPSTLATFLAASGVMAIETSSSDWSSRRIRLPSPAHWPANGALTDNDLTLRWIANTSERNWVVAGGAPRAAAKEK